MAFVLLRANVLQVGFGLADELNKSTDMHLNTQHAADGTDTLNHALPTALTEGTAAEITTDMNEILESIDIDKDNLTFMQRVRNGDITLAVHPYTAYTAAVAGVLGTGTLALLYSKRSCSSVTTSNSAAERISNSDTVLVDNAVAHTVVINRHPDDHAHDSRSSVNPPRAISQSIYTEEKVNQLQCSKEEVNEVQLMKGTDAPKPQASQEFGVAQEFGEAQEFGKAQQFGVAQEFGVAQFSDSELDVCIPLSTALVSTAIADDKKVPATIRTPRMSYKPIETIKPSAIQSNTAACVSPKPTSTFASLEQKNVYQVEIEMCESIVLDEADTAFVFSKEERSLFKSNDPTETTNIDMRYIGMRAEPVQQIVREHNICLQSISSSEISFGSNQSNTLAYKAAILASDAAYNTGNDRNPRGASSSSARRQNILASENVFKKPAAKFNISKPPEVITPAKQNDVLSTPKQAAIRSDSTVPSIPLNNIAVHDSALKAQLQQPQISPRDYDSVPPRVKKCLQALVASRSGSERDSQNSSIISNNSAADMQKHTSKSIRKVTTSPTRINELQTCDNLASKSTSNFAAPIQDIAWPKKQPTASDSKHMITNVLANPESVDKLTENNNLTSFLQNSRHRSRTPRHKSNITITHKTASKCATSNIRIESASKEVISVNQSKQVTPEEQAAYGDVQFKMTQRDTSSIANATNSNIPQENSPFTTLASDQYTVYANPVTHQKYTVELNTQKQYVKPDIPTRYSVASETQSTSTLARGTTYVTPKLNFDTDNLGGSGLNQSTISIASARIPSTTIKASKHLFTPIQSPAPIVQTTQVDRSRTMLNNIAVQLNDPMKSPQTQVLESKDVYSCKTPESNTSISSKKPLQLRSCVSVTKPAFIPQQQTYQPSYSPAVQQHNFMQYSNNRNYSNTEYTSTQLHSLPVTSSNSSAIASCVSVDRNRSNTRTPTIFDTKTQMTNNCSSFQHASYTSHQPTYIHTAPAPCITHPVYSPSNIHHSAFNQPQGISNTYTQPVTSSSNTSTVSSQYTYHYPATTKPLTKPFDQ